MSCIAVLSTIIQTINHPSEYIKRVIIVMGAIEGEITGNSLKITMVGMINR